MFDPFKELSVGVIHLTETKGGGEMLKTDWNKKLCGNLKAIGLSKERFSPCSRASCDCLHVLLVYEDKLLSLEHVKHGEGRMRITQCSSFEPERYSCFIRPSGNTGASFSDFRLHEDGTVDSLRFEWEHGYLFIWALENNLTVLKAGYDAYDEKLCTFPETEESLFPDGYAE